MKTLTTMPDGVPSLPCISCAGKWPPADALCKALQLQKRNIENPPGSKVMSEVEDDHITSYLVPPAADEQFNVELYPAALRE